jgi:S1-C subfamily serine protease
MRTARTIALWLLAMLPAAAGRGQTVLYDFYAERCPACREMSAAIDQLAADGYAVERIDVDRQPALARQYAVTSIPCFVVVEGGNEIERIVGRTSIERLKLKLHRSTAPPRLTAPQRESGGNQSPPERRPHPAWRYEKPVGHRAAVVRIFCRDDVRTRSIGSGTLVRWGAKKIVVLTARHVVADARKIVVELFNKKTCEAHVLKVDAVWDCAVLELQREPEGVVAAEVELGPQAMQHEGSRLESCGYGPDGKLAANSGLFLGYKRSTQTPNGPDDWFEISGHARPGDSGGGVFNERGRLVGVLWGTNGEVVVGVQAGRLHRLLDAAVGQTIEQRAYAIPMGSKDPVGLISPITRNTRLLDPSTVSVLQLRQPTPPKPAVPLESLPPACDGQSGCCPTLGPVFDEPAEPTAAKKPILPWRGEAQAKAADLDARTQRLLQAIEAERQARLAAEHSPQLAEPPKTETKDDAPSPLAAGLCVLAAIVVGFVIYFAAASKNQ